ncbi:MAG: hypothetical protein GYA36_18020 [Veillonellaceae bacterium]|nr:hypothetical protein [Veillonellaceae bacterium]
MGRASPTKTIRFIRKYIEIRIYLYWPVRLISGEDEMVDGAGDGKPAKKKVTMLVAALAIVLVAALVISLAIASTGKAPGGNEDDLDTSDDVDEDKLVSGVASEFILNESDMGADWIASDLITGPLDDYLINESVTSVARITFKQYNSTGQLEYMVEISTMVFGSINNASASYNKAIEIHPEDDSNIKPEYRPSYPVIIANVSIGDGGVIIDLPRITQGHEAKALVFLDRNVGCGITYHHGGTYDPLPNELLIDLANKVAAKIV